MQDKSDAELLREYAGQGSEAAFREIVTRHADLMDLRCGPLYNFPVKRHRRNFPVSLVVMRKTLAPVLVVLLFAALLVCGCTRSPSAASISRVAVARSNREAKRLYNIEPFKQEHGQLRIDGQQSVWEALTSSGGHDLTAKVTFDEHGSVVGVDVRMLSHPTTEPVTNFNNLFRPERQREKQGIPDVMPK